jgi:hypothetical protein
MGQSGQSDAPGEWSELGRDRDRWISVPAAAEELGMSQTGVKRALERGTLIGHAPRSEGNPTGRWRVSALSVAGYRNRARPPGRPPVLEPSDAGPSISSSALAAELRQFRVELAAERSRGDALAAEVAAERGAEREALRGELDAALQQVQALAVGSAELADGFARTMRGVAEVAAVRQRHLWAEELKRPGPPEPPGR